MSRRNVLDENGVNRFVRADYQLAILLGMNRTGKHIYPGTADPAASAKRHTANKVARAQRKRNLRGW